MAELATSLAAHRPALSCAQTTFPRQSFDWDCGYANADSLLRVLGRIGLPVPDFFRGRGGSSPIEPVQRLVEAAWRAGFDPQGVEDFGGSLVGKKGKRAWIGGSEMLSVFWCLHLDAFTVEVECKTGAGRAVFAVAEEYFGRRPEARSRQKRKRAQATGAGLEGLGGRPHLVLQGAGHSRCIVGVLRAPERVLVRDPQDADTGRVRCLAPADFEGRQWMVIGVEDAERPLSAEEVQRLRGPGRAIAIWRGPPGRTRREWEYDGSCTMRFSE